ncbi:hypothetical protein [Chitinimonas sp.]|uniref:hypothetical protein n=1 Tax=Chitinimonas sp. TaxID=1934313 RepID=UPI0035AEC514
MSWIVTNNGEEFDLLDTQRQPVDFKVIAHSLSQINRFNGHTRRPYSVAEHCVRMVEACKAELFESSTELQLAVLLHDAAEAYIGDIVRPLKLLLGSELRQIEAGIQQSVHLAAGLPPVLPVGWRQVIQHLDMVMLATEKRDLLHLAADARPWVCLDGVVPLPAVIEPWPSYVAEAMFMQTLQALQEARSEVAL